MKLFLNDYSSFRERADIAARKSYIWGSTRNLKLFIGLLEKGFALLTWETFFPPCYLFIFLTKAWVLTKGNISNADRLSVTAMELEPAPQGQRLIVFFVFVFVWSVVIFKCTHRSWKWVCMSRMCRSRGCDVLNERQVWIPCGSPSMPAIYNQSLWHFTNNGDSYPFLKQGTVP